MHCLRDDDEVVSTMQVVSLLPVSRNLNRSTRVHPIFEAKKQFKGSNTTSIHQHLTLVPRPSHHPTQPSPNHNGPLPHVPRRYGHGRIRVTMPDERRYSILFPHIYIQYYNQPLTSPPTDALHLLHPKPLHHLPLLAHNIHPLPPPLPPRHHPPHRWLRARPRRESEIRSPER